MRLLTSLMVFATLLVAQPARAGDPPPAAAKRIKLEGFNVDGTVQKPQAFYVLPRTPLTYTGIDRPQSFVAKIKKSVQTDPF